MNHGANYHRVFWLTTAFTVVVIAIVVLVVPARPRSATGSIDWLGAVGLAAGLSAVLLAITQGHTWGWTSPRTVACAIGGLLITAGWWLWERRAKQPLVSTKMLSRRPILLTNLATVFVGMGLYFAFLGLTQFVQIPPESGYGFGATVLEASVIYLLPGAITGRGIGQRQVHRPLRRQAGAGGRCDRGHHRFPVHRLGALWQVIAASILANAYISLGYGALPALVVSEVTAGETGVATMNAIARTIGSSIAAALVAVLLGRTAGGTSLMESSFVAIFVGGAVTGALAMALIALSRVKADGIDTVEARYESRAMNHEWG